MSNSVQNLVRSRILGTAARKGVLLAMADAASDDGTGIFKSAKTVAGEADVDVRTVRRVWAAMEGKAEGLIIRTGVKKKRGGELIVWRINLDALRALPEHSPRLKPGDTVSGGNAKKPGDTVSEGDTESADRVTQSPQPGDTESPEPLGTIIEPSLSEGESKNPDSIGKKAKASPSRIPEDWTPTDPDRAVAISEGVSASGLDREILLFRDHWLASASANAIRADWGAAWRNWVRSDLCKKRHSAPTGSATVSTPDYSDATGAKARLIEAARNSHPNELRTVLTAAEGHDEDAIYLSSAYALGMAEALRPALKRARVRLVPATDAPSNIIHFNKAKQGA